MAVRRRRRKIVEERLLALEARGGGREFGRGGRRRIVGAEGRQQPVVARLRPCHPRGTARRIGAKKAVEEIDLARGFGQVHPAAAPARGRQIVERRQQPAARRACPRAERIGQGIRDQIAARRRGAGRDRDQELERPHGQDIAVVQRRRHPAERHLAVVEEGAVRREVYHNDIAALVLDGAMAFRDLAVRVGQHQIVVGAAADGQRSALHHDGPGVARNHAGALEPQRDRHCLSPPSAR
ncbi:hypothetical protein XINFAN_03456 [Pseudogemmobacter humi]|uniref:Uncharacterized protein n=1 Tax=Pseudogemmobacter humi TaxID=2483812 RepID=A0A3P5XD38_9RHOB|nr:hypothetical protein XINFAN_03456 [Pseudogemmobacter humi]